MVHEVLTAEAIARLEPRAAAAYFILRRAEGLTASEKHLLDGWLASDEMNRRMFESADHAWGTFADVEGDEILAAMRASALAPQRARAFTPWRPALAVAAVLLVAIGSTLFFAPSLSPRLSHSHTTPSVAAVQYTSARGEVRDLSLPDGSHMTLDADSAAVARFGADGRTVQLQKGRAYFEVLSEPARPFTVAAGDRSVVAVGTRFDVNLVGDGLTVTLIDGRVNIAAQRPESAPVVLDPGQQYIERQGKATVRNIGSATENATAWRTGLINFDDQSLTDAVAVMNRYSQEQIVVNDPGVGALKVSGQFRAGDGQRFAATLADMHRLKVERRANGIELVRQQ